MNELIVHVLHASTYIPDDSVADFTVPEVQLHEEAELSTDLHTDRITRAAWPEAEIVERYPA